MVNVASAYSAGITRTKLSVVTERKETGTFTYMKHWVVDRGLLGAVDRSNEATVFINETGKRLGEAVWVGIVKGYNIAKHEGEFLMFRTSVAACESGALIAAKVGAVIRVDGYKNRTPPKYFRLVDNGVVNVTEEVNNMVQEAL